MDLKQKLEGIKLVKATSVKPYKEATESKSLYIEMDYSDLTIEDILAKALKSDVIDWQNGSGGRKNYKNLVNGETIKVKASAPGSAPQIDPETAMILKLQAMSPEEQEKYLAELASKVKK